jgi:hypothetical protein
LLRERRKLIPEERPACEWPWHCGKLADDWNEKLLRSRGGSITDPKNRMWLCRDHHDYFHAHPKEMHELGLMPHAWENQTWRGESEYLGNGGQNIA